MHVLYIEDDPRDVKLVEMALARSGSTAILASVPDEALAIEYLLRRGDYSGRNPELPVVIFLDLKLEDSRGSDLIGQIRDHPSLAFIPIMMLTSSRDPLDVAECYRRGANAYMAKSIDFRDFAEDFAIALRFWSRINVQTS